MDIELTWDMVIGAMAVLIAVMLVFVLAYPFRQNRKRKAEAIKAALSLINEITEARKELKIYLDRIDTLEKAYESNSANIPKQLPSLRLQLDKIVLSQKFGADVGKLVTRAGHFRLPYNQKCLYTETAVAAAMFANMISLLKTSKVSGFMRSTKMLEEYITQRHASPFKKGVVDTFAEDYFEENAYNIRGTLKGEKDIFDANETGFDVLIKNLDAIVKHSQALF
ncbi:hypothetical protein [Asticcacaulis endophyticus]|uniref:Uncharacterized protein n=1 Tax=Asticcacaulis endophyticus TaxID=1395890 RepID=A0A918UPG1_9CAUL|nr:hypothetical protein [Asticcacaulis endophyticus]GGZ24747.1 hypothetical protein GCM10011273_07490 [Asticcacaulis endophyticus]